LLAGALAFAVSSCTTNDPNLQLAMPGTSTPAAPTIPGMMADVAADHAAAAPVLPGATPAGPALPVATASVAGPDDPLLPDVVAYVPTPNPENPFAAAMPALAADAATTDGVAPDQLANLGLPETAMVPAANPQAPAPSPAPDEASASATGIPSQAAAYADPAPAVAAPKRRGFFASLFSPAPARTADSPAASGEHPMVVASLDGAMSKPLIDQAAPASPVVDLAPTPAAAHRDAEAERLPGVRTGNSLFEITRKSGGGDNSDVDIDEEDGGPMEVASAAGMARLDPHGLLLQRETVDTACLRPALLSVLKRIEAHYGRKLIVTSGYRTPIHNVAAHGALNSLHMFCAAADVQMPGVSKWELAAYARSMPGRGGVGTYCYTKSVHVDIGPERDWNWRCRRKRHRR
jgi:uncharacterized protein YcbK (DUF882 family)